MRRRVPRVRRMANPRAFVAALGALAVLVAFAGAHRAGAPARFQPVARTMRADGSDASAANGRPWKPIVADDEPEEAWYQNPIGRMAYVVRVASGLKTQDDANVALAFVDITGLENVVDTRGFRVMDVPTLKNTDRALYDQLGLADRPHIQTFAIIPEVNEKSVDDQGNKADAETLHSEQMLILQDLSLLSPADGGASMTPERFFALYTDRSPCKDRPGRTVDCADVIPAPTLVLYGVVDKAPGFFSRLQEFLRSARVQSMAADQAAEFDREVAAQRALSEERGETKAERLAKAAANGGYYKGKLRYSEFQLSASAPAKPSAAVGDSGLARALSEPNVASPGGIDFSHLQLGYLADPGDGSGLQYAFQAPTSLSGGGSPTGGLNTALLASDAFFVWLELDPSTFWVNLNPSEPDRVVDPQMGLTDVGRIMLQADLRLKKDVGTLIHPGTRLGDQFWSGIDGDCLSSRVWVVPAAAQVYNTADKLYILSAPLNVKMESDYVQLPPGQCSAVSCPQQDDSTQAHNEALFRSLILPQLVNLVNTDPSFADLRTIYRSRVAAEWYRNLSASQHTTYADLIDHSDIAAWTTKTGWTPTDTFQQYVTSYTKGDYHLTRTVTRGNFIYTYTYTYGGVDLTDVPLDQVSAATFAANDAGSAQSVSQSLTTPTASGSGTIWLGSLTPLQAAHASPASAPDSTSPLGSAMLRWLPLLLLPIAAAARRRRRRIRTPR
jgi:hypothetical protein